MPKNCIKLFLTWGQGNISDIAIQVILELNSLLNDERMMGTSFFNIEVKIYGKAREGTRMIHVVLDQNWGHQYELRLSLIQVQILTYEMFPDGHVSEVSIYTYFLLGELKGPTGKLTPKPMSTTNSQFLVSNTIL